MANEAAYDNGSQSSASSANNQSCSFGQETPMVRVPSRMILNLMLQELGIPEAEYCLEPCGEDRVCVIVHFNTSTLALKGSPADLEIPGDQSTDHEIAEDTACIQAIRCIQSATYMEIKDFNYARLKQLEEQNIHLKEKLKKVETSQKKLAKGWLLAVRHMSSFAIQIRNVFVLNYSLGEDAVSKVTNTILRNLEGMAFRLKCKSIHMEKRLEKIRAD